MSLLANALAVQDVYAEHAVHQGRTLPNGGFPGVRAPEGRTNLFRFAGFI